MKGGRLGVWGVSCAVDVNYMEDSSDLTYVAEKKGQKMRL